MLELIELTNLEVLYVMGIAFSMGVLFGLVLFYVPAQTKLDTLARNSERKLSIYRNECHRLEAEERDRKSAQAGEYYQFK